MTSAKDIAIKKTGEMLLSGWKMLGMACPICNTVILSKNDCMRCPGCDMPVVQDMPNANFTTSDPNAKESIVESAKIDVVEDEEVDIPKSYEEMRQEYDRSRGRRDEISSKLGEKMLLGWILLGNICPLATCNGTPLMRENQKDEMLCVSCGIYYIINKYGEIQDLDQLITTSTVRKLPQPVPTSSIGTMSQHQAATKDEVFESDKQLFDYNVDNIPILSFERETDDDKVSQLISTKLLQGWAMLDKVCSNCDGTVPLLRDHAKQEHCVACESQASSTAKKSTTSSSTAANKQTKCQIKNAAPSTIRKGSQDVDDASDASDDDFEWSDDLAYEQYVKQRLSNKLEKKAAAQSASNAHTPASTCMNGSSAFHNISAALEEKMMRVMNKLSANDDDASSITQALLVQHLAMALQALAQLK